MFRCGLYFERFKKFTFSIGIYAAINVFAKLFPFFLLPILTSKLTPTEFGKSALFIATISLLIPFVSLRADSVIIDVLSRTEGRPLRDDGFDSAMTLPLVMLAFLLIPLLCAVVADLPISKLFGISWQWLLLAIVAAFLWSFIMIGNAIWQFNQRFSRYAAAQLAQAGSVFTLTLVLILGPLPNSEGRNIGYALPVILIGAWSCWKLCHIYGVHLRVTPKAFKHFCGISLPLIMVTLASIIAGTIDRFAITYFFGIEAVGIYAFGVTLGLMFAVLTEAVELAWLPYLVRSLREHATNRMLLLKGGLIIVGLIICSLIFALLLPYFVTLLGRGELWGSATSIAFATLIAVVAKSAFNICSSIFIYSGGNKAALLVNFCLASTLLMGIVASAKWGSIETPQYLIGGIYAFFGLFFARLSWSQVKAQ